MKDVEGSDVELVYGKHVRVAPHCGGQFLGLNIKCISLSPLPLPILFVKYIFFYRKNKFYTFELHTTAGGPILGVQVKLEFWAFREFYPLKQNFFLIRFFSYSSIFEGKFNPRNWPTQWCANRRRIYFYDNKKYGLFLVNDIEYKIDQKFESWQFERTRKVPV